MHERLSPPSSGQPRSAPSGPVPSGPAPSGAVLAGSSRRAASRARASRIGLLALGGLVGAVLLAACSSSSAPVAAKATCGAGSSKVTVQGTGLATGTPNVLTVDVGINVVGPTAQAALADDNTTTTAVTNTLTEGGVAAKDVQTTDLSINPQYNSHGVITGYAVTDTLTAELRNFSTAGSTIDAVANAGGNATRIDSLSFSVQDTRGLEDSARTDAVRQAVSHARSMALAANERLGPICSLSDQTQTELFNQNFDAAGAVAHSAASSAPVPLEPGSQQETAQVTMVYALNPPPLHK